MANRLFARGLNNVGQLGTGNTVATSGGRAKIGDYSWVALAAGDLHSLGIRSDGLLFAWGDNSVGQLGDGTTVSKSSPVQIGTSSWRAIAAGTRFSLGIIGDGTPRTWGLNNQGQLSTNDLTNRSTPTVIFGGSSVYLKVAAGAASSYFLRSDNALFTSGRNFEGQLGDNTTIDRSFASLSVGGSWVDVAAGGVHALGIKSGGTLWAWGDNTFGQLGNGTTISRSSPVQVLAGSTFIKISGGDWSSYAIRSDNILFSWGRNEDGQLGLGDFFNRSTPVQVSTEKFDMICGASTFFYGRLLAPDTRRVVSGNNLNFQLAVGDNPSFVSRAVNVNPTFVEVIAEGPVARHSLTAETVFAVCGTVTNKNVQYQAIPLTVGSTAAVRTTILADTGSSVDDQEFFVNLPFTIYYLGVPYSRLIVSTNSYVVFGKTTLDSPSPFTVDNLTPAFPKIGVGGADNSARRIVLDELTTRSAPNQPIDPRNRIAVLRFEGSSSATGASGVITWEMRFFQANPSRIEVHVQTNDRGTASNLHGFYSANAEVFRFQFGSNAAVAVVESKVIDEGDNFNLVCQTFNEPNTVLISRSSASTATDNDVVGLTTTRNLNIGADNFGTTNYIIRNDFTTENGSETLSFNVFDRENGTILGPFLGGTA